MFLLYNQDILIVKYEHNDTCILYTVLSRM